MKDRELLITSIIFMCLFLFVIIAVFSPLSKVFLPFITSFMLCYFFAPLVNILEKLKIKRIFGTAVVYAVFFSALAFILIYAFPLIYEAVKELYSLFAIEAEKRGIDIYSFDFVSSGADKIYTMGIGAVKKGAAGFVGAAASFYIITDIKKVKSIFAEFVPDKLKPSFHILIDDTASSFNAFFRGQIVIAFILFLLEGTLLFALGIPYAWLLGLMGGLLDIIPYAGAFAAIIIMCAVTLVSAPKKILFVLIGFFIIQQLENNVISPKVSSDSLSIHPAAVILTLYVGSFGGFWGILLAVPLACVFRKITQRLLQALI